MARHKRIDFTQAGGITISLHACVAIAASAAEVFPKECMGCLCGDSVSVWAAFPYQVARRKNTEVVSKSSEMFKSLLDTKVADYHSHTFEAHERLAELEPSAQDFADVHPGAMEVIVRVHKVRNGRRAFRSSPDGSITGALGLFRFQIRAFVRLPGVDKAGFPRYKTLRLELS